MKKEPNWQGCYKSYPIISKLPYILLKPSCAYMLPQFQCKPRNEYEFQNSILSFFALSVNCKRTQWIISIPNICSSVQSDATLHQQKDLLALAGLGDTATVHKLQHIGLQIQFQTTLKNPHIKNVNFISWQDMIDLLEGLKSEEEKRRERTFGERS